MAPTDFDSECVKQYWPQNWACRRWKCGYPETKTALTADRRLNGDRRPDEARSREWDALDVFA